MTSQELLLINLAIGALIGASFLMRKAPKEPTRLKLQAGRVDPRALPEPGASSVQGGGAVRAQREREEFISKETLEASEEGMPIRSLNVMFNYNGHSWDAYEVLGLPAGASARMATEAYERAVKSALPSSHAFLRTAHLCILNSKK